MQTDSVLDAQDREIMWRWGQPATREFFTENASNCSRIAGELSRLEQENQRLQARVDSLDCAHKLAMGEVERLTKENTDSFKKAAQDECLRQAREANPWIARETDPDLQCLREKVAHEHSQNIALHKAIKKRDDLIKGLELSLRGAIVDLERQRDKDADGTTTRDALTAARAEVQRLRDELTTSNTLHQNACASLGVEMREAQRLREELAKGQSFTVSYEVSNAMDANNKLRNENRLLRMERDKLRENAEMDQAQRVEWQETIDKLEAENARISNQLRLALIISEPGKVDSVMERISLLETTVDSILSTVEKLAEKPHDHGPVPMLTGVNLTINGILERISTLEGRVQGITEIVKQELAIIVERLRELEERVNRPSLVQEFVNSGIAEVRRLRAEMEQPVPPARNPFEDLRPPRGL